MILPVILERGELYRSSTTWHILNIDDYNMPITMRKQTTARSRFSAIDEKRDHFKN